MWSMQTKAVPGFKLSESTMSQQNRTYKNMSDSDLLYHKTRVLDRFEIAEKQYHKLKKMLSKVNDELTLRGLNEE